jgi:hypothetical protein
MAILGLENASGYATLFPFNAIETLNKVERMGVSRVATLV